MGFRKNMKFEDWVEITFRRKWLLISIVFIAMFTASVYCVVSPELYKSETAILVMPQKIPESYVESTARIEMDMLVRLNTLKLKILSGTRLLGVIKEMNLFPELRSEMGEGEAVREMRSRVGVEMLGSKKRNSEQRNVFTIAYAHEDPEVAMLVNSKLTSMIIGENVKIKEQQALGAVELFQSQILEVEKRLEAKDKEIKDFRQKYIGQLPEQLTTNLGSLTRYQDELKANREAIRFAQDKKLLIETQIAELKAQSGMMEGESKRRGGTESVESVRELAIYSQLTEKKSLLSQLQMRYTENHPEIKRLKIEIAELENQVKTGKGGIYFGGKKGATKEEGTYMFSSPEATQLTQQLAVLVQQKRAAALEIKNLKQKDREISNQIYRYTVRVERTPTREEELKNLIRDYDNLKLNYEDLMNKKMSADLSKKMESRQQGEHFEVINPASLPKKPFKPARVTILVLTLLFSICAGVGSSLGLEYLDKSINSPGEFKELYDIPVLVSLPLILTQERRKKVVLKRTFFTGGVILYFVAVLTFVFLYMDRIMTILRGPKLG